MTRAPRAAEQPPDAATYARFCALADDPNAYATLQPQLVREDVAGGFVAYAPALGRAVVSNDPIVAPARRVEAFATLLERHPRAVYVNLSAPGAQAMAEAARRAGRPVSLIPYGTEHVLDTERVACEAPAKPVRGALKQARRAGLRLDEVRLSALDDAQLTTLRAINDDFLARSQAGHELPLVARKLLWCDEPGVRVFLMVHSDRGPERLFGLCTLDPWWSGGALVGYQLHQIRFAPTRVWGVYLSVVHMLASRLYEEGIGRLALGGCVFHGGVPSPALLPCGPAHRAALGLAARLVDRVHGMSGFTRMKLLFPGEGVGRYLACEDSLPLAPLLCVLRASRALLWPWERA